MSDPSAKVTPIFAQLVEEFRGRRDEPPDPPVREPSPERDRPEPQRPSE